MICRGVFAKLRKLVGGADEGCATEVSACKRREQSKIKELCCWRKEEKSTAIFVEVETRSTRQGSGRADAELADIIFRASGVVGRPNSSSTQICWRRRVRLGRKKP